MHYKTIFSILLTLLLSVNAVMSQTVANDSTLTDTIPKWHSIHQIPLLSTLNVDGVAAVEYAYKQARQEFLDIIDQEAAPTFENTIVAFDRAGIFFRHIDNVYYRLTKEVTEPKEFNELGNIILHYKWLLNKEGLHNLNGQRLKRIKTLYEQRDSLNLNTEQRILLEKVYLSCIGIGINMTKADNKTRRKLNFELGNLTAKFRRNIQEPNLLYLSANYDLSGLPKDMIAIAAELAKEKGKEGYIFDLNSANYPLLMRHADNRVLRELVYKTQFSRCVGGKYDNLKHVRAIANCRLEIANLFGYKTYADFILIDQMTQNAATVNTFLADLTAQVRPYAKQEYKDLQIYANKLGFEGKLQAWDYSYYSEKLQIENHNISPEMLKPYFELNTTRDAVFDLASRLFSIRFEPNYDIPVYHKDVQAYDVYDTLNTYLSTFYLDLYDRDFKNDGAWMSDLRTQYIDKDGNDVRPLILFAMNIPPMIDSQPVLLTFGEFKTFLHEFGHCIHAALANCTYDYTSGTGSIPRDFLEFPPQFFEKYATEMAFLNTFAKHYQTGEKIPQEFIEKIKTSNNFHGGRQLLSQLYLANLDMAWHSITEPVKINAWDFENTANKDLNMAPNSKGIAFSPQFTHVFTERYRGNYYAYVWSDVLAADAFTLFQEKGLFDIETATKLRVLLSKRAGDNAKVLYREFRGKDATTDALLKYYGLE